MERGERMSKGREAKTEGSKERQGDPKRREDNRKMEGRGRAEAPGWASPAEGMLGGRLRVYISIL